MHILQNRLYSQKISLKMFRESLVLHISIQRLFYTPFSIHILDTPSHTSSRQIA